MTATPLAGVGICSAVPDIRGAIHPSNDPILPPGHVLDRRFLIREIAGRSGSATIYRAEDLRSQREVAVKVPLAKIEVDPAGFSRFRHEEEIGVQLSHPSLLRFYPVEDEKSRPYLVTEFLRGCTLNRLAGGRRPVSEPDALKIAAAVCEGLEGLHAQGFVHRDIKPENIMICVDRTIRILDFGLASPPTRWRNPVSRLGTPFGTPQYMAPEQVERGAIDERTDIYCLGAMLYELLTGSTPLADEDPWNSAFRRVSGDPVAPRELNPAISPQAEEIVLHSLQRKAEDRHPSAAALRSELEAPERVIVTGYRDRLRAPRWRLSFQATPMLAGALLGFSVVAALTGFFYFMAFRR